MVILAAFSMWFFVGALMALVGVGATMDLLSGKSFVLARLIPSLRLLEKKKVRRTQQAAAQKAGVIKVSMLGTFVLLALVGVGVAITELRRSESRFALAEVPANLTAEHTTVVEFLQKLESKQVGKAFAYCQNPPLIRNPAGVTGIRDEDTGATLEAEKLTPIRSMKLIDPNAGPLIVELFDNTRLKWKYRPNRRPGDEKGGSEPLVLVRIEPPPPPTTQPALELLPLPPAGTRPVGLD